MELAKIEIAPQAPSQFESFEVLFNPNSYTITKSVTWTARYPSDEASTGSTPTNRDLDAPPLQFGGGSSRTLTLELFFDVTEPVDKKGQKVSIADVRQETGKIVALTRKQSDPPHPPVCVVSWGNSPPANSDFPFVGVVTNLTQNFTLFKKDGRPVRAKLTVVFTEYLDPEDNKRETDPELTTRIVKRGDTLSSIAAEVYRDPTLWRMIAEANRIDDPRRLEPGQSLTIPQLS
jgi:hypothetical protein